MRLYSHFDTFELYNIRRGVGKLFFCFFASLFSFRRTLAAARAAFHGAMHRAASCTGPSSSFPAKASAAANRGRSAACTAPAAQKKTVKAKNHELEV